MAPWCHLLKVDLIDRRRVRRHLVDQVRKNTFTNIIYKSSTTTETNDTTGTYNDFPISLPNPPTVKPPPSDVHVPLRVSEHSEPKHSDRTMHPTQCLLLTLIDVIVLEGEE